MVHSQRDIWRHNVIDGASQIKNNEPTRKWRGIKMDKNKFNNKNLRNFMKNIWKIKRGMQLPNFYHFQTRFQPWFDIFSRLPMSLCRLPKILINFFICWIKRLIEIYINFIYVKKIMMLYLKENHDIILKFFSFLQNQENS